MTINNKDPFNVYLVDEYVNSWNELYKMCKSKNKVSILCNLL